MSTQNHKPATTSDILTNPTSEALLAKEDPSPSPAPVNNSSIHKSNNPFSLRARCGKVARLPKEIRDQLNEMLLDGIPHAQIIQKLRDQFGSQSNVIPIVSATGESAPAVSTLAPSDGERAGVRGSSTAPESPNREDASASIQNQKSKIENLDSLTPHHLTTWKKYGGYRDWLKDQQRLEECKLRHELTLDLARSAEGLASYQAAPKVAVAQICQTIIDLGPEGLKDAMKDSPLNCFRLLNALARLINSGLKCETQIHKAATAADGQKPQLVDRAEIQRIEKEINLL
jgi:hypothetical protein